MKDSSRQRRNDRTMANTVNPKTEPMTLLLRTRVWALFSFGDDGRHTTPKALTNHYAVTVYFAV